MNDDRSEPYLLSQHEKETVFPFLAIGASVRCNRGIPPDLRFTASIYIVWTAKISVGMDFNYAYYDDAFLHHPQPYMIPPTAATFPTPSELAATSSSESSQEPHKPRRRTKPFLADPPPLPEQPLLVPPSDGISSHEKKRHYLECLEQYVMYLHQQLLLVGLQPISLERSTSNVRGMTSKSIRVRPSLSLSLLLFIHSPYRLFLSI